MVRERDTFNEINITPLTDIFLVLLIIMMVIAPLLDQQGLNLTVPENVAEELNKIAGVLPEKAQFYLDAEGRLKGEDGHISAEKCKAFINNALQWQKSH